MLAKVHEAFFFESQDSKPEANYKNSHEGNCYFLQQETFYPNALVLAGTNIVSYSLYARFQGDKLSERFIWDSPKEP